jgi:TatD DNase family protein
MYTDTHCHLQDERLGEPAGVMKRSRAAGVERVMCCATAENDWEVVEHIGRTSDGVAVSFGVHPWLAGRVKEGWEERLENRLRGMASGVGEIGLDFMIEQPGRDTQERVFVAQLEVANRLDRPVSIHCRRAWGPMIELLKKHRPKVGGVMHSYAGSVELLAEFGKLGLRVSFSGTVTRPRRKRAREAAAAVDPAMLLVETDSPDQPPAGCENAPNEPAHVTRVARTVAQLRGITLDKVAALTSSNYTDLFGPVLS